jgi:hypothetical protein
MKANVVIAPVFFLTLSIIIINVGATVNELDVYFETVRGQLLGFYGSEIVSHAGIILGLIIALPSLGGLLWKALNLGRRFSRRITRSLVLVFFIILILYSVGRLIYWSSLGASVALATREKLEATNSVENATSYMPALVNYTRTEFWNDPGFTYQIAKIFYPQNRVEWYAQLVLSWIISSLVLTGVVFLYDQLNEWVICKRKSRQNDKYLETLGF